MWRTSRNTLASHTSGWWAHQPCFWESWCSMPFYKGQNWIQRPSPGWSGFLITGEALCIQCSPRKFPWTESGYWTSRLNTVDADSGSSGFGEGIFLCPIWRSWGLSPGPSTCKEDAFPMNYPPTSTEPRDSQGCVDNEHVRMGCAAC